MRKIGYIALAATVLASQPGIAQQQRQVAPAPLSGECGFVEEAPIFGVGMAAGTDASPILIPLEQGIVQRGDRSSSLRSIQVPAMQVTGWPADYAMMRLAQAGGRQMWAVTESGQPGDPVTVSIPATNLADAFDRIAAVKGKRWRYDGEKAYLLGGREWTVPMPASRDLAFAVKDALSKNRIDARIDNGVIRFMADDAGASKVTSIVSQVYAQPRLNPYDVKFYKVYPTKGAVDWAKLAERTEAVETVSFDGKGATVVLDPTAGSVIEAFLAGEGEVRSMGSTTMVSAQPNLGTLHVAGCGAQADSRIGLELAGGAYERGRVPMRYSITGGKAVQAGAMAVTPGSVVVIADGEPRDGAYMVAVVRPRVIELQSPAPSAVEVVRPKR